MRHDGGLFDFARFAGEQPQALTLIRAFADAGAFRSATVDELELPDDSFRRPLRPEDLEFLSFKRAIRPHTVSQLPSLATQRLLFCINELSISRLPRASELNSFRDFHRPDTAALGERIRPYLQAYGFDYASRGAEGEMDPNDFLSEQRAAHASFLALLSSRDQLATGAGFIALQFEPLLDMQRRALNTARAQGMFDALPAALQPGFPVSPLGRQVMEASALPRGHHANWQFYLSASLGRPNLLWAFVRSPADLFAAWGAFFAAEADWGAFLEFAAQAAAQLGVPAANTSVHPAGSSWIDRVENCRRLLRERWGDAAVAAFEHGFNTASGLHRAALGDLTEQLRWLADIPRYVRAAALLEERIERENPGIDRETFVEPREMCSTTHVHNDHRLVVIESGDMIFWGNPGMRLTLHPGERVLIPAGRLHGSTVTSEECTYHQPIIPEPWMLEALDRAGNDAPAR